MNECHSLYGSTELLSTKRFQSTFVCSVNHPMNILFTTLHYHVIVEIRGGDRAVEESRRRNIGNSWFLM